MHSYAYRPQGQPLSTASICIHHAAAMYIAAAHQLGESHDQDVCIGEQEHGCCSLYNKVITRAMSYDLSAQDSNRIQYSHRNSIFIVHKVVINWQGDVLFTCNG